MSHAVHRIYSILYSTLYVVHPINELFFKQPFLKILALINMRQIIIYVNLSFYVNQWVLNEVSGIKISCFFTVNRHTSHSANGPQYAELFMKKMRSHNMHRSSHFTTIRFRTILRSFKTFAYFFFLWHFSVRNTYWDDCFLEKTSLYRKYWWYILKVRSLL